MPHRILLDRLCLPGSNKHARESDFQARRFSLLLLFCFAFLVALPAHAADPVAYVGVSTQDYVTRFDPVTGKSTKLTPAGLNATSFVVSPDGSTAYVARFSYYPNLVGGIDILNLSTGKKVGGIDPQVASNPTTLGLSSDGYQLYFVGAGSLQVFDTTSQTIVAQTPIAGAGQGSVALVAGGSEIYVSSTTYLQAFNTQTLQPITINGLPKSYYFEALAASPDGKTLYVATPDNHTIVSAIDTTTNTVIANFPYSNEGGALGLAVSPDGQTLYLANQKGLFRLSTATGALLGQLIATPLEGQIAPSPDGKYVYVNRAIGGYIPGQPDSLGSNFPGLLQIDVASGAIQNLSVGGVAIAELFPVAASSIYVLQTLPYINTEDPNAVTVTGNLGAAGGTELLTASANGAVVAGVTNPSYLLSPGEAIVTLIDTAASKISGQFTYTPPAGDSVAPYSFTMNGDASVGYIGVFVGKLDFFGEEEVAVLNLPQGSQSALFPVTGSYSAPAFLAVSPDGSKLYSVGNGGFCSTDLQTYSVIGCAGLGFNTKFGFLVAEAVTFALNTDGSHAYIPGYLTNIGVNGGAEILIEVDTSSLAVVSTLELGGMAQNFAPAAAEAGIVYSSAANSVYIQGPRVATQSTGALMRVDLGTFTIAATQPVNYLPNGMAITPDGTKLLVTGSSYGTQIFDGTTLAYTSYIPGGLQNGIVIPKQ